jgi:hypothetical protein
MCLAPKFSPESEVRFPINAMSNCDLQLAANAIGAMETLDKNAQGITDAIMCLRHS